MDLLEVLKSRLSLSEKFREKYIKEVQNALGDYNLTSFEELTAADSELWNKIHVPYIFSTIESGVPSLFDDLPQLLLRAGGKNDEELTDIANQIWGYLKHEIGLKTEIEKVGFMFMLAGTSLLVRDWVYETAEVVEEKEVVVKDSLGNPVTDEDGIVVKQKVKVKRTVPIRNEPSVKYVKMKKWYVSPESEFVEFDKRDKIPYVIIEETMTVDEVEYVYGKKVEGSEVLDLKDKNKNFKEWLEENPNVRKEDMERVRVYTYIGTLPKKVIGKNWRPHQNYKVVFTDKKVLKKPQIVGEKNVHMLKNYGSPESFFGFGEAYALRKLERDVSFGRSKVADYRDKLGTKIGIPVSSEVDEESLKDPRDFTVVRFAGSPPEYISPPIIPQVVLDAINMSRSDIQTTSGQLDISRGGDSNTVTTATGQKIFAAVHEKRIRHKREKLARFMAELAKYLLRDCGLHWEASDLAKVIDISEEEIIANGYLEKLAGIDKNYDVIIDPATMMDNSEAESAQAIALFKLLQGNPLVNQEELLKTVLKMGFKQKDVDKYLSRDLSPERLMNAVEQLVNMGLLPKELASDVVQGIAQMESEKNKGGRPMEQNPVDVMRKSMPGADNTQISAQNQASYKQMGPKP